MKTQTLTALAANTALSLTACVEQTGPNTQRGTVMGGLTGAALGGIVGQQSGRGLEGAALGGAVGAGTGAMLGNAQDGDQRRRYNNNNNQDYDQRRRYNNNGY